MVSEMAEGLLNGRHIMVTGGASGIGRAIVEDCLAEGAAVSFVDIDVDGGQQAVTELKQQFGESCPVSFARADVTKLADIQAAVSEFRATHGPILGLVNNAGRNSYADPVEMTEEEWDEFFDLDLKASWLTAKVVLPMMREAGTGSIIQIASIHARMSYPQYFPYAAAKSGLIGLTRNMALDEGKYGIRVNAVSPGYTETPLLQSWFDQVPGSRERVIEHHPLGHIGKPSDIAHVVSFLLSDRAGFVSGAEWPVDGALSARFAS